MTSPHYRTGSGFDVHGFDDTGAAITHIRLFGLDIPFNRRLRGHSDADVVLHALCDAIYGAAGNGDIGFHFPPSDMRHKNRDSHDFLNHALHLLRSCGGELVHVDLTLIGEEPKMNPHRDAILAHLSVILDLPRHAIGLKATTTERLGFTGRREGLAAQAVVTAHFPNGYILR